MDYRKTIEHLRRTADTFEKSGYAVDGITKCFKESADAIEQLVENLQILKDKQEQGLLIVLPVAEGTEVWCIGSCGELCDNWMECEDCKEHEIVFSTNFDRNMVEQWGKTIFLTESKAEEALAKIGGSHEDTD